jgi:hypothetical protein
MAGQYILGAAGAVSAYVFGHYFIRKRAARLPLELPAPKMVVAGGIDILPLVSAVLDSLPSSVRINMNIKVSTAWCQTFCSPLFWIRNEFFFRIRLLRWFTILHEPFLVPDFLLYFDLCIPVL